MQCDILLTDVLMNVMDQSEYSQSVQMISYVSLPNVVIYVHLKVVDELSLT